MNIWKDALFLEWMYITSFERIPLLGKLCLLNDFKDIFFKSGSCIEQFERNPGVECLLNDLKEFPLLGVDCLLNGLKKTPHNGVLCLLNDLNRKLLFLWWVFIEIFE